MINEFGSLTPMVLIALGVVLMIGEMFIVGTFAAMFLALGCIAVGVYGYADPTMAWEQQLIAIVLVAVVGTAFFYRKLFNQDGEGDVTDKLKIEGSRGIGTFSRSMDGAPSMVSYRGTFFAIHPESLKRSETLQSGDAVDMVVVDSKAKILS